ncbi:MAG: phage holin family protein [Planctomycetaceae bacterium]|nr:phage holin family protein [Planctomycetaceae bacterium]
MNGRTTEPPAGTALRQNIAVLAHDVITLTELQAQLFTIDLRETWQRSLVPLGMLLGGTILALGAIPVLLLGIGWVLVRQAGWSEGAAFATTSGGTLLVAAIAAWVGWQALKSALATLLRSKAELTNNVHWIKSALKQPS